MAERVGISLSDAAALERSWWTPDPVLFVGSCGLLLIVNLASGLIWARMVADLGGPKLAPGVGIGVFLVANMGRYVPGKVWQIAGLVALAKRRGVPGSIATGAAIVGHGLSLAAAAVVGGVAMLDTPVLGLPGHWLPTIVFLCLVILLSRAGFDRFVRTWTRWAGWNGDAGAVRATDARRWVTYLLAAWVGYAGAFSLLAFSYGVTGPAYLVGPAFVAAYFLGYVALFAPAGLGVREVALTSLLTPVTGVGAAMGLAVVARLWVTVVEVLAGAIFAGRELAWTRAD